MKKLIQIALVVFAFQMVSGQVSEPVVKLAVLGPEISIEGLNQRQLNKITTKVEKIISKYGIVSTNYINDFVIYPTFEIYTDDAIEGTYGKVYDIEAELTLKAINIKTGSGLATSFPFEINGSSRDSRNDAITKAIGKIKTDGPEIESFVMEIKAKIIDHYLSHCNDICEDARKLISLGQTDTAITLLMSIPTNLSGPCAGKVKDLLEVAYVRYNSEQCREIILEAQKAIAENKIKYAKSLLALIGSEATCSNEKQQILNELDGKTDETPTNEVDKQVQVRKSKKIEKVSESVAKQDDKALLCAKRLRTDCD